MDYTYQYSDSDIRQGKLLCVLSYLWLLWVIPLVVRTDSPYVRFHTNQGIVLCIAEIVAALLIRLISAVFLLIPVLGVIISVLLWAAFGLVTLLFVIKGIAGTLNGKAEELPFIGQVRIMK